MMPGLFLGEDGGQPTLESNGKDRQLRVEFPPEISMWARLSSPGGLSKQQATLFFQLALASPVGKGTLVR